MLSVTTSRAGVRVDEPGPPRLPRVKREPMIEGIRVPRIEITVGPASLGTLGLNGGGWMASAAIGSAVASGASWVARLDYGLFQDLHFLGMRTTDIREGRIDAARSGEFAASTLGLRAGGLGRSHAWIEASAGIAGTRLEHVRIETIAPPAWWRYEDRSAVQAAFGVSIGHRWPVRSSPVELMTEFAATAHLGAMNGSDLSLRFGVLGARPTREP